MNTARDALGPLKLVKSRIMLPISRQSNAAATDMRSCSAHPYLTENSKIIAYIGKPKEKSKPRDMRWNTPFNVFLFELARQTRFAQQRVTAGKIIKTGGFALWAICLRNWLQSAASNVCCYGSGYSAAERNSSKP